MIDMAGLSNILLALYTLALDALAPKPVPGEIFARQNSRVAFNARSSHNYGVRRLN